MDDDEGVASRSTNLRGSVGWHRLARFGAYLCALAQEVCSRYDSAENASSGCAAPVESKATQPGPPCARDQDISFVYTILAIRFTLPRSATASPSLKSPISKTLLRSSE